eukprot:6080835-Pyramimonas_sp.AAC.1
MLGGPRGIRADAGGLGVLFRRDTLSTNPRAEIRLMGARILLFGKIIGLSKVKWAIRALRALDGRFRD